METTQGRNGTALFCPLLYPENVEWTLSAQCVSVGLASVLSMQALLSRTIAASQLSLPLNWDAHPSPREEHC